MDIWFVGTVEIGTAGDQDAFGPGQTPHIAFIHLRMGGVKGFDTNKSVLFQGADQMPQLFIREMILKRVGENGDSSGFPDQADCLSRSDLFPRDKVGTGISYITCESFLM